MTNKNLKLHSHTGEPDGAEHVANLFNISTTTFDLISNRLYHLEPLVNRLRDHDVKERAEAIRSMPTIKSRYFVNLLKPFRSDPDEAVREEAREKLKRIESFYRRKFFFFQNKIIEFPSNPGYRFGFAVTSLRYAQVWVKDENLQEYFLAKALRHFNRIIRTFEPKPIYFYYRGQVYAMLKNKRLAVEDFSQVLSKKPNHIGASFALIRLYYSLQEPENVVNLVDLLWSRDLPPAMRSQLLYWRRDRAA